MGEVTLSIAGRMHTIACRDGDELRLERLGELLNRHAEPAQRASGGNYERTLVLLSLIIADMLDENERHPSSGVSPVLLENLADRLEAVAATLEDRIASA